MRHRNALLRPTGVFTGTGNPLIIVRMLVAIITARLIRTTVATPGIVRVGASSIVAGGAARGTGDETARILSVARLVRFAQTTLFQQPVLALNLGLLVGPIASTG
jgi:hypothetical protein